MGKKEDMEKKLEGDDDKKDNDDEENRQWIDFFENIANTINLDDEDEGDEVATAGRSISTITIKTEEEKVPDSIPSKSSMIEMEEEVDEEGLTSITNNTLVRVESTITGRVTACEDQQQGKKDKKKKKEEEAA